MSFNYNLISCNTGEYPSITNLCTETRHPYEGKVVYIDEFYNGQPVSYLRTYTLTYLGENVEVCNGWLPLLGLNFENSCSTNYEFATYRNCTTGGLQAYAFPLPTGIDDVFIFKLNGECDCWEYFGEEVSTPPVLISAFTEYFSCEECLLDTNNGVCDFGERSLSYAVKVQLFEQQEVDRGFKECCYINKVFADLTDSSEYKNDYTGIYFKRETPSTTVDFILMDVDNATEYNLNSDTYGTFQDFGGANADLSYYIVDWNKVLTLLGEGNYQLRRDIVLAGIPQQLFSNTYYLQSFTVDRADGTVRLDCIQDGFLVNLGVDFKDTGYKTTLRLRGFFGRKERSYEKDYLFKRNYESEQITMNVTNEYLFEGLNLPECIADELLDFIVLGNNILASDYNKNNHSYNYKLLEVELSNNENTGYNTRTRGVKSNLVFTDRFNNRRKTNC